MPSFPGVESVDFDEMGFQGLGAGFGGIGIRKRRIFRGWCEGYGIKGLCRIRYPLPAQELPQAQ